MAEPLMTGSGAPMSAKVAKRPRRNAMSPAATDLE